ncbi:MAG: RloB family protein [Chloroflexota bacterium]
MARKQRAKRQSKKVFLFIVEGSTEENYLSCLKRLFRRDAEIENCRGGNARGVMMKARQLISKHDDYFAGYVVWFDRDRYSSERDADLKHSIEAKPHAEIVLSEPCIENWLLAHFQPTLDRFSSECSQCGEALRRYVPDYVKNDLDILKKFIDLDRVSAAIIHYPEVGRIPQHYFST